MGHEIEPDFGEALLTPEEKTGLKIKVVQTKKELADFEAMNISKAQLWLNNSREADFMSISFCLKIYIAALVEADNKNIEPLIKFVRS